MCRGEGEITEDCDHIHHRVVRKSRSYGRAVNWLYAISYVFGLGAVIIATLSRWESLLIAVSALIAFMGIVVIKLGYLNKNAV